MHWDLTAKSTLVGRESHTPSAFNCVYWSGVSVSESFTKASQLMKLDVLTLTLSYATLLFPQVALISK